MNYRAEIDGLRAFAVLTVVVFHAFPGLLRGGFVGVDVFFVISGYLITGIIFGELDQQSFRFGQFFARRIRRLFPALILVLLACLTLGWFALLPDELAQLGTHTAAGAGFIANFVLWGETGYFDNAADTKPLLHLWSLGIEEQFYLLWPLVLWMIWKLRGNLLLLTVGVGLGSLLLNLGIASYDPNAAFFSPQTRFWELMSGSVLAWASRNPSAWMRRVRLRLEHLFGQIPPEGGADLGNSLLANMCAGAGMVLLVLSVTLIHEGLNFPGGWGLLPVAGAVLVIGAGSAASLNRVLLTNRVAVFFGAISYPLYLWHWPLLAFARIVEGGTPAFSERLLLVALAVLLAWLTYRWIETPVRFQLRSLRVLTGLVLVLALTGMLGYGIAVRDGVESRFAPGALALTIPAAANDWDFPDDLLDTAFGPANSLGDPEVLLYGDSHMEQYGPRVAELGLRGEVMNALFITGDGCPPIPDIERNGYEHCQRTLIDFRNALQRFDSIERVVIAACWNCYFPPADEVRNPNRRYYIDVDSEQLELHSARGRVAAMSNLRQLLSELAARYEVYLVLDNPGGTLFDPRAMLQLAERGRRVCLICTGRSAGDSTENSTIDPARYVFARGDEELALVEEMRTALEPASITMLDPAPYVCPQNRCASFDESGRPLYKDTDHMRPFFVKAAVPILDPVLLRLR